jgi:hypothetical protein
MVECRYRCGEVSVQVKEKSEADGSSTPNQRPACGH